jgi:nucleotide-binding universal stress UspA family protein
VDYYGVGARQAAALDAAVEDVRRAHPGLVVEAVSTHLDPRDALLDEAAAADLLVLGSSEPGVAHTLLLGSVARTAARRSPCPVVVVRGRGVREVRRIVVGIDGSSAAMAALDWACDEANRHGADLSLLHTCEHVGGLDAARAVLDDAVHECRQRTLNAVHGELLEGSPSAALVRASRNADLVAIGSRGRSGFKTALFGSVALSVAEHAECPVAITHPRMRR